MKRFLLIAVLVCVGVMAWSIGNRLSTDALGMAVGILFGMSAGIPAALLVLVSSRRRTEEEEEEEVRPMRSGYGYPNFPGYPQPPVIVVTGHPQQQFAGQSPYQVIDHQSGALFAQSSPNGNRQFRLVGESEMEILE